MNRLTRRKEDGTAYVQLYSDPDRITDVIKERARKEVEVIGRLAHYEDLEEQGRLLEQQYNAGDWVYVIERDVLGEACEVSGYIFIASCRDAVIVSPRVNGSDDVDDLLKHQITETAMEYNGDLSVFPKDDCYSTKEEAEAKLAEGGGVENG